MIAKSDYYDAITLKSSPVVVSVATFAATLLAPTGAVVNGISGLEIDTDADIEQLGSITYGMENITPTGDVVANDYASVNRMTGEITWLKAGPVVFTAEVATSDYYDALATFKSPLVTVAVATLVANVSIRGKAAVNATGGMVQLTNTNFSDAAKLGNIIYEIVPVGADRNVATVDTLGNITWKKIGKVKFRVRVAPNDYQGGGSFVSTEVSVGP
jgi:hypothetical protein